MLPNKVLSASTDIHITATITGRDKESVALVGCSTKCSVTRGKEVNSFSILLPKNYGDKGIVAVRMMSRSFLINFSRGQDVPLNLESDWVPIDGRLGQIYPDGTLVVTIGSSTYGTSSTCCDHLVNDPDLLCRYLSGNVDSTAIITTAEKVLRDYSEIVVLREKLADVNSADKVKIIELKSSLAHCDKAMINLLDTITNNNECATQLEQEKKRNKRLKMLLSRADRFIVAINEIAFAHPLGFWCSKSMHQIRHRLGYYWN